MPLSFLSISDFVTFSIFFGHPPNSIPYISSFCHPPNVIPYIFILLLSYTAYYQLLSITISYYLDIARSSKSETFWILHHLHERSVEGSSPLKISEYRFLKNSMRKDKCQDYVILLFGIYVFEFGCAHLIVCDVLCFKFQLSTRLKSNAGNVAYNAGCTFLHQFAFSICLDASWIKAFGL